jgi:hypothetical protein
MKCPTQNCATNMDTHRFLVLPRNENYDSTTDQARSGGNVYDFFGKCPVRISAGNPTILTEAISMILHFNQLNASTHLKVCHDRFLLHTLKLIINSQTITRPYIAVSLKTASLNDQSLKRRAAKQKSREIYLNFLTLLYRRVKGWRVKTCFVINGTL